MRLQTKTSFFYLLTTFIVVVLIVLVSLLSFRQFSISTAKNQSQNIADLVLVGLTELMVNGVIDKREQYLQRLTRVNGLLSTRVTRSDHIRKQFNKGFASEAIIDDIDKQVLDSGKPVFILENEGLNPVLRSTIPFIASSQNVGEPNCLSCHKVAEGTVLGTITIRTEIGQLKRSALTTVALLSAGITIVALISLLFFRKLFQPLLITANDIQKAVTLAKQGDFTVRIKQRTDDEIGQIANDFNQLMTYLQDGLNHINQSITQLIDVGSSKGRDSLANTVSMIDSLADAAKFKQSIEEDESKEEVYQRLGRVLHEDFYIREFSIYEVDSDNQNKMTTIMVDGKESEACSWCDPQILVRSDACRAKRTGHLINGIETPHICNAFQSDDPAKQYICIPIIQSGSVGSVVQIICDTNESSHYQGLVPFIMPYLKEASPVIESKRLMATLKESNLRDPMTGLNNRRFLEEYVETLVATTTRQKSSLSILMLDLDYFKKVNDTYGHDVGDIVLVALSKVLRQSVRASDLVIRYGGEEFLIILQNSKQGYSDQVAEKIRKEVESMKIAIPGGSIQKTISIGVADFPEDGETFWQTLKYADVALYKAKENGRNRFVHFSAEMWEEKDEY